MTKLKFKCFIWHNDKGLASMVNDWLDANRDNIIIVETEFRTSATSSFAHTHVVIWYEEV
jgi:hypothetical protein